LLQLKESIVILVDYALHARHTAGKPIRVGLLGAGFMVQGLTNQIRNSVPGMRVVAIYSRKPQRGRDVFGYSGQTGVVYVDTQGQLDKAIAAGVPAVTEDAYLLARSDLVDVIVDVTGSVEFGAQIALEAFKHQKTVVLMNAEIDATIGPILQVYAKKYGAFLSACDGDEPGVQMNLVRWVKGLGLIPRVVGNIKGLQDPYRNPTTQKGFAEQWGQNPAMVTSFADGSKISFEQTIVANATGFKVRSRGMSRGLEYRDDIMKIGKLYDIDEVRALGGIIDYVVGTPLTKVYVLAEHTDPKQQKYLNLYKMGEGPLYSFFTPYHLVHFEVPNSIARAFLFRDLVAPPLGGPVVEVCAVAKRDLAAGEVLDDYGMYMTYGEAVNSEEMNKMQYLPEGLVEACTLRHPIKKDTVLTYADVDLPPGRLADKLRAEQYKHFGGHTWLEHRITSEASFALTV
jgi:predicted homoserine dehydrogenase-like protein